MNWTASLTETIMKMILLHFCNKLVELNFYNKILNINLYFCHLTLPDPSQFKFQLFCNKSTISNYLKSEIVPVNLIETGKPM